MKQKREEKKLTLEEWQKEDARLLREVAKSRIWLIGQQDWSTVFELAQTVWNHGANSDDTILGVRLGDVNASGAWPLLLRNGLVEVGIFADEAAPGGPTLPRDHHHNVASDAAMASVSQEMMVASYAEKALRDLDNHLTWLRDRRLAEKPSA